jgi:hypothetical protein
MQSTGLIWHLRLKMIRPARSWRIRVFEPHTGSREMFGIPIFVLCSDSVEKKRRLCCAAPSRALKDKVLAKVQKLG